MTEPSRYLSAEDIFAANDIQVVEVEVPEWGGVVRLRTMSGLEALHFVELSATDKAAAGMKVLALCAVKEDGSRLFTDEQIAQLQAKSLRALMRLQKTAMEMNGLMKEEADETKNA